MNNSSYEQELALHGKLVYTNIGVSMMPLLRQHRDLMIIEKRPEGRLKKYDAVLYKRGEKYILHRILQVRPRDYVICGDNCWRREFGITDDQIIGVLVGVVRDGREISVTDRKYQCYVHLWCDFYLIRAAILIAREKFRAVKHKLAILKRKLLG